jgi:hypothetical protein
MRFAVTVPTPPNYPHAEAVREVAESLCHGLVSLGHDAILTSRAHCPGRRHVIFCPHVLPHLDTALARDAVLYNLEQIGPGGASLHPELLDLFRRHVVWDYSQRNIQEWARLGVHGVRHLPVGYVPQLSRICRDEEDIDVLFYGSVNERRQDVLDALRRRGVNVEAVFGVYGSARDCLIARARIVLNLHYHESKVFEVVRVSYLLANERFVVCERGCDPTEAEGFAPGVVFADYGDLVQACVDYLGRPEDRGRIARAGFELMSRRDVCAYLRRVLDERSGVNERQPNSSRQRG